MKSGLLFISEENQKKILEILRKGSTAELKLISGRIDVVEIKRSVKIKIPLPTGGADG